MKPLLRIAAVGCLLFSTPLFAREALNNSALFARCYAQLTQTRVAADDPLLAEVAAGTKSPVAACLEVLDKAKFNANGRIEATNEVGKNVLRTLHKLHASWFTERDFVAVGVASPAHVMDAYDVETAAMYVTRALFQTGVPYRYIVQANKHLRPVRANMNVEIGIASNQPKSKFIFDSNFQMAATGEMLGVQEVGNLSSNYNYTVGTNTLSGTVEFGKHFGGGILGSTPYLLMNVLEPAGFKSNGAEAMPRKWARAAFADLLCRDLPVVRYADVGAFRVPSSTVPFRQTQGCVQCHASMDRLAATIRGIGYKNLGNNALELFGGAFPTMITPNGTSGANWPSAPDSTYSQKEPDGVFFFRNYKGVLRDISYRGLPALGNTLAGEEDLFVCAAKRYYSYFMGVDVPVGDPQGMAALTPVETTQKTQVETLGKALKDDANQSLRTLIKKIFELPAYRNSDFSP